MLAHAVEQAVVPEEKLGIGAGQIVVIGHKLFSGGYLDKVIGDLPASAVRADANGGDGPGSSGPLPGDLVGCLGFFAAYLK